MYKQMVCMLKRERGHEEGMSIWSEREEGMNIWSEREEAKRETNTMMEECGKDGHGQKRAETREHKRQYPEE